MLLTHGIGGPTLTEYIDREAVMKARHNCKRNCQECDFAIDDDSWCEGEVWITDILRIPAADVRPVMKAHWINYRTIKHDGEWYCSACGKEITIYMGPDREDRYKFCPNCGAKMEES